MSSVERRKKVRSYIEEPRGDAHRNESEQNGIAARLEPSASETVERSRRSAMLVAPCAGSTKPSHDGHAAILRRAQRGDIRAARKNVPAATVAWSLFARLEELRAKLDARLTETGASGAWLSAIGKTRRQRRGRGRRGRAQRMTGVLIMNALGRTAIVAALVLSAVARRGLVVRPTEPLSPVAGKSSAPAAGYRDT